ncbi:50S ribosomal protein L18 [Legionella sp. W05-934-2]|jgi:large subunit ribosomal protein L18|uniref:50S ribosomal protein L18 n=1 Tax=Legionella sp. W05-934-2 TaxID=1198649 RepID=UPI0034626B69
MNNQARERRSKKTKMMLKRQGGPKIVVFRSGRHIYAQVVDGGQVIVSCSTLEKELKGKLNTKKVEQAHHIGKLLGERAIKKGINRVAFDRSGYKYHGRVKAVAEGAREGGLEF